MLKKGIILLLLIASLGLKAQEHRLFSIWNKNEVNIKPWEDISLSVADRMHYSPKSNALNAVLGQIALEHEPTNWLGYGAAMRISHLNKQNGIWLNETRPFVFVNLNKGLKEFELSFSNRIEYRSYKELHNHFRHKQTLKLKLPALLNWGMRFYVSEESFYKLNGIGTHLARFQSGVTALEKNWFALKIYYILEKTKAAESWLTGDIIGLNLSFDI